jgi:hypothetical protein
LLISFRTLGEQILKQKLLNNQRGGSEKREKMDIEFQNTHHLHLRSPSSTARPETYLHPLGSQIQNTNI